MGAGCHDDGDGAGPARILVRLLGLIGAHTVVEVGAGRSTFDLVTWAEATGGGVVSLDPEPPDEVCRLARNSSHLTLLTTTGLEGLAGLDPADAYLLDGDHNHYTVSAELDLLAAQADQRRFRPLVAVGGTGWPWARRDEYHRPDELPPAAVRPYDRGGLRPGSARSAADGWHPPGNVAVARREGGAGNGVLTAVEDWLVGHPAWTEVTVPGLGGTTLAWRRDAAWAGALSAQVGPLDRHPLLDDVESGRVAALVRAAGLAAALAGADRRSAERSRALQADLDAARAELALRAQAERAAGR